MAYGCKDYFSRLLPILMNTACNRPIRHVHFGKLNQIDFLAQLLADIITDASLLWVSQLS